MAAGLTTRQKYNRMRSILGRFAKRYNGTYSYWNVVGIYNGHNWSSHVSWGNMSNGESIGTVYFFVDGSKVEWRNYEDLDKILGKV